MRECLQSINEGSDRPDELIVVNQGPPEDVARLVSEIAPVEGRTVPCAGRGVGTATNLGLQEARNETVLVTHDDCTVAPDWVSAAGELARRYPGTLLTGRVLPAGEPSRVPSTIDAGEPRDYTGSLRVSALFPNNMVMARAAALELGGFDDRVLHAEDNDFCYRWLRRGLPFRYEPSLVVWHHDWRDPAELEALYVRYGRGQGRLYAKHLRKRDRAIWPFVVRDLREAAIGIGAHHDREYRRGLARGLIPGIREGWRIFGRG